MCLSSSSAGTRRVVNKLHIGKDTVFWEENLHAGIRQLELGFDLLPDTPEDLHLLGAEAELLGQPHGLAAAGIIIDKPSVRQRSVVLQKIPPTAIKSPQYIHTGYTVAALLYARADVPVSTRYWYRDVGFISGLHRSR